MTISLAEPAAVAAPGAPTNRERLAAFVESAMRRTVAMSPDAAKAMLLANATVLRRHLTLLGRYDRAPAHLVGLTAFDLSDAADALEAAAGRL